LSPRSTGPDQASAASASPVVLDPVASADPVVSSADLLDLDLSSSEPSSTAPVHPYGTLLRNNIRKFKVHTDGTVTYSAIKTSSEPTSYTTTMIDPLWRQAMNDESQSLLKNKTWHLVSSCVGLNIIYYKWVLKLKHKPDGSIDHHKARLVAKGFKQQYGVDYDDTFSPVVKPTTIHVLLPLAISHGWVIRQIDIQNAFLHGFLDEDVYMK
jgi:hypothetical protein